MRDRGKTVGGIVREYFPGESDEFVDDVLWNETGYPYFWNIPRKGTTPEECLRYQLGTAVERRTLCLIPMDIIEAEMRAAIVDLHTREAGLGAY